MPNLDSSADELIAAELLWEDINVGDTIEIEADLEREGRPLLKAGVGYEVIAKHSRVQGATYDAFYVQSDICDELVAVSPAFISNYHLSSTHQQPC